MDAVGGRTVREPHEQPAEPALTAPADIPEPDSGRGMEAVGGPAAREPAEEQQAVPIANTPAGTPEPDSAPATDDADGSHSRSVSRRWRSMRRWWRANRAEVGKDAIIALLVLLGAFYWDDRLADRQDGLARDLADRAEVLENTRFVRQLVIEHAAVKPLSTLNLQGADLAGLDPACESHQRPAADCADLRHATCPARTCAART